MVGGTLLGLTQLNAFSNGSILNGATVGELVCNSGSDLLFCDGR